MGAINFYLKKPEGKGKGKRSLIFLQFKYGGSNRLVYSFGQKIHPDNWNPDKQRVKSNNATTEDGKHLLNDLLDNLEKVCNRAYNTELQKGYPPPAVLRRYLSDFIRQNEADPSQPTFYKLVDRFISGEIKHKGKEKSPNTIKTYRTTLNHLKEFEQAKKYKIDYNTLDLGFLYKFITYLRDDKEREKVITTAQGLKKKIQVTERGLSQNAIAKDVQIIKTFMKKAVTLRESNNTWHEHEDFTAVREETEDVYLKESEILELFRYDLSDNERLQGVRDLFVFGCFTGLRFSDYSAIKPENIVQEDGEYFIKIKTQKTKEWVYIPTNPVILEIFDRYKNNPNKLPHSLSNQKFNKNIKNICALAGFIETGRIISQPELMLYECISSHTARRSFVTNTYLQGFPSYELMKITGHRSEKSFMRYLKISRLESAKKLSAHTKKVWSKIILQAV